MYEKRGMMHAAREQLEITSLESSYFREYTRK